jgi:parallel beta-helix repeat protein
MLKSVGRTTALVLGLALATAACGGGGGGSSAGPPPPNPLYVRVSGRDTNSGADPANALGSISRAAQIALSGYTIYVGPGTYVDGVNANRVGTMPQGLMFIADVDGSHTGDNAGPVIINATGSAVGAGFSLANTPGSLIDGFTIAGGADAGIVIKSGSTDFVIRNCIIANNPGDGIRVQDSSSVLVFNNIVYNNAGIGIGIVGQISGSPDAQVYSNTIVGNGNRGITIGNSTAASPNAMVHNNIVQNNGTGANPPLENIKVFTSPRSDLGYDGDYNLVFPATYLPSRAIDGSHDLNVDARFVNAAADNFHLQSSSPAIDMGGPLAGLPNSESNILRARTTTGINLDSGLLDMGFHFLRGQ